MHTRDAALLVRLLVAFLGAVGFVCVVFAATQARAVPAPGQIAYPGNGKIYLIDATGTNRQTLVSDPKLRVDEWGGVSWSRDAKQIAFTVGHHMDGAYYGSTLRLYLAAGDGTNPRPLTGTARGSFDPTWSPDNSRIAFATRTATRTTISVIGVDGQGLRTLASSTNPRDFYWVPDWSPDGSWILFEIGHLNAVQAQLMAVRPDGTGLHQVTAIAVGNHCICADWSPDGDRIAYQAPGKPVKYDYPEIWVMNADGTGRVQLTANQTRDENPDWSPDGTRLAFYSERVGNAEIYVIPATGGQAKRVTHDPWYDGPPRWRPVD